MNPQEDGEIDADCNCLRLPYSDGASFSGYRADPWPVPESLAAGVPANATVTFRGIKNFDAALDFALVHGLRNATEFVLSGPSAGGLATFLHADRAARRVRAEAPMCKKVAAAPEVGYFLDHDNFRHTAGGQPNSAAWAVPGTGANFTTWMRYIYSMQNLTFGADGALSEACRVKHPEEPWFCFMSPHMQDVVATPFFMFNSKYDAPPNHIVCQNFPILLGITCACAGAQTMPSSIGSVRCWPFNIYADTPSLNKWTHTEDTMHGSC